MYTLHVLLLVKSLNVFNVERLVRLGGVSFLLKVFYLFGHSNRE